MEEMIGKGKEEGSINRRRKSIVGEGIEQKRRRGV